MTIQEAIKKSIEGGWIPKYADKRCHKDCGCGSFFLDPSFWKALGKAKGWTDGERIVAGITNVAEPKEWLYRWHRLIDHLAEEKNVESYFATIK